MAGALSGESSLHGMVRRDYDNSHDKREEPYHSGSRWYFSRKEIEENSPSRKDGIDLKKETYLRKSYCTFLQDLGMRLKVPQVTIATAIVFCHRFFLRQSHAKNDRRTIATVCMFLAGKVEETPRPLKDVILVSYEIIHKKDPSAVQRIKQKEVYEQQKELILLGERVVLATLGFDLNVHHPYKPLVEAIKKFKVAQNALAQVAWNFVNDGLRTSLCLQFKPHHIAAGAIFLAAKFLKVKLPSDGEKVWWQEFDVTPRQLEDVSNQMLELYEQNRTVQSSHANEVEGSTGTNYPVATTSSVSENPMTSNGLPQAGGMGNVKQGSQIPTPVRPVGTQSHPDNRVASNRSTQNQNNDNGSADSKSGVWDHNMDSEVKDSLVNEAEPHSSNRENMTEASSSFKSSSQRPVSDVLVGKDEGSLSKSTSVNGPDSRYDAPKSYGPPDVITKIDKDKVKAALEKRKKLRNDAAKRTDLMNEDDLIERELENGIELAVEDEKIKQERRQTWPKPLNQQERENQSFESDQAGIRDQRNSRVSEPQFQHGRNRSKSFDAEEQVIPDHCVKPQAENAEEGELSSLDEHEFSSPKLRRNDEEALSTRNHQDHDFHHSVREAPGTGRTSYIQSHRDEYDLPSTKQVNEKSIGSGRQFDGKQQHDFSHHREASGIGRMEYAEREHKRHRRESHG